MIYDPGEQFSTTTNPTGVWSYGYNLTLGGPMSLYTEVKPSPDDPDAILWIVGSNPNVAWSPVDTYDPTNDIGRHAKSCHFTTGRLAS